MENHKLVIDTLITEIEALQAQRKEILIKRDQAITKSELDSQNKALAQCDGQISLQSNRLHAQQKAEAEAARDQALQLHQEHLAAIGVLQSELTESDQALFTHLSAFYGQIQGHMKSLHELVDLTQTVAREARDLGELPVPIASLSRLGVVWNKPITEIANDLILAFSGQFWQAFDSRKNGTPVREDFPSVDSLSRFGRIHDWSPWLVKPEVVAPAEAEPVEVEPE